MYRAAADAIHIYDNAYEGGVRDSAEIIIEKFDGKKVTAKAIYKALGVKEKPSDDEDEEEDEDSDEDEESDDDDEDGESDDEDEESDESEDDEEESDDDEDEESEDDDEELSDDDEEESDDEDEESDDEDDEESDDDDDSLDDDDEEEEKPKKGKGKKAKGKKAKDEDDEDDDEEESEDDEEESEDDEESDDDEDDETYTVKQFAEMSPKELNGWLTEWGGVTTKQLAAGAGTTNKAKVTQHVAKAAFFIQGKYDEYADKSAAKLKKEVEARDLKMPRMGRATPDTQVEKLSVLLAGQDGLKKFGKKKK